jgi:hypothetical protein
MSLPNKTPTQLAVYRRVDWTKNFTFKDENGTAHNLNNSTLTSEVWNAERSKKYCDISCTITDASNGKFRLSLTEGQTTILPTTPAPYFDVKRTVGSDTSLIFRGEFLVKEGYTS